jgi:hypothetical protein
LLLTVIFMSLLDRVREGRTALLWWLPALTILWTNLHGGFIVGLIVLGLYGAGELVRAALAGTAEERRAALKTSVPYFATLAGCLAASLVNPYFYQLHVHIAEYLRDPYLMRNINEFQSANFHHRIALFLEALLALGLLAAAWSARKRQFGEALLVIVWAHMALYAARNIPLFCMVAAPVAGAALVDWLKLARTAPMAGWLRRFAEEFSGIAEEMGPMEKIRRVHAVCAVVLAGLFLAMSVPEPGAKLKAEYDPQKYPAGALAVLNARQRIFTDDEWGDYLIYRMYPAGAKVFIDGRSDFYGEKFCTDYLELLRVKYDWQQRLRQHNIDTVLLSTKSALASTIKESSQWRVVYDDGSAIVFRSAEAAANEAQNSISNTGGAARVNRVSHNVGGDQL